MRIANVLLAGILLCGAAFSEPLSIGALRCEYLDNPLGIDVTAPRLSWVLSSPERGARQTAWQILVASTSAGLAADQGDLWDSGKVSSHQSVHVVYSGKTLASGQDCFWKVRVWNTQDEASSWSPAGHWSMGLLADTDWKGDWIGIKRGAQSPRLQSEALRNANWIWFPGDAPASPPPGERFFRTTFEVSDVASVESVQAWFTADNRAELFFNGESAASVETYNETRNADLTDGCDPE